MSWPHRHRAVARHQLVALVASSPRGVPTPGHVESTASRWLEASGPELAGQARGPGRSGPLGRDGRLPPSDVTVDGGAGGSSEVGAGGVADGTVAVAERGTCTRTDRSFGGRDPVAVAFGIDRPPAHHWIRSRAGTSTGPIDRWAWIADPTAGITSWSPLRAVVNSEPWSTRPWSPVTATHRSGRPRHTSPARPGPGVIYPARASDRPTGGRELELTQGSPRLDGVGRGQRDPRRSVALVEGQGMAVGSLGR